MGIFPIRQVFKTWHSCNNHSWYLAEYKRLKELNISVTINCDSGYIFLSSNQMTDEGIFDFSNALEVNQVKDVFPWNTFHRHWSDQRSLSIKNAGIRMISNLGSKLFKINSIWIHTNINCSHLMIKKILFTSIDLIKWKIEKRKKSIRFCFIEISSKKSILSYSFRWR